MPPKILSIWIDGEEYVITKLPEFDISGQWVFQDSSHKAIIKSENDKFKIKEKELDEEAALVNARLARILTVEDYDFKQNKPRLWSPASDYRVDDGTGSEVKAVVGSAKQTRNTKG